MTTTERKVGVVVLPLYHPMRVVREIGLLDQMSDGRVVLGVGTGYQCYEFENYNVPLAHKTDVFLEYWNILEQGMTRGHATVDETHVKAANAVFIVRPQQRPMPDLFLTTVDPRIVKSLSAYDLTLFFTAG